MTCKVPHRDVIGLKFAITVVCSPCLVVCIFFERTHGFYENADSISNETCCALSPIGSLFEKPRHAVHDYTAAIGPAAAQHPPLLITRSIAFLLRVLPPHKGQVEELVVLSCVWWFSHLGRSENFIAHAYNMCYIMLYVSYIRTVVPGAFCLYIIT